MSYRYIKPLKLLNIIVFYMLWQQPICIQNIINKCENQIYCNRLHVPHNELLIIDKHNNSTNPCIFLTSEVGCSMIIPHQNYLTNNLLLKSCELDKKRNHFYKPRYVCEQYFYQTSLRSINHLYDKCYPQCIMSLEDDSIKCDGQCGRLHIPWKNFVKNMFNSKIDKDKSRCITFLIGIIENLVNRDIEGEEYEFKKILTIHNRFMEVYKSQYHSRCIKCGLPPYKYKLQNPKIFSIYALIKSKICIDLANHISTYLYNKHKIHKNGCFDCIFIFKKIPFRNNKNCIEVKLLSKMSSHGEDRVLSYYPPYNIYLTDENNNTILRERGGPPLDTYPISVRNSIWPLLLQD